METHSFPEENFEFSVVRDGQFTSLYAPWCPAQAGNIKLLKEYLLTYHLSGEETKTAV